MLSWASTDRLNRVSRTGRRPELEVADARGVCARQVTTIHQKQKPEENRCSKEIDNYTRTHGHISVKSTKNAMSTPSGRTSTNTNTTNKQYCERTAKNNGLKQPERFSTGKGTIHKNKVTFSTVDEDFDLIGDSDPYLGVNKHCVKVHKETVPLFVEIGDIFDDLDAG